MNHKKIAELAHVSTSTVSKALSGSTEISSEVAEQIKKIAMECGYFKEKSKRKRAYRNNSSLLIAVLVPELLGSHYPEFVTHLKNEIEAKGAQIAVYIYDFDQEKANAILKSIIVNGAADGVIMCCRPELPTKPTIPIVYYGGKATGLYDSIGSDVEALIEDCVKYLKQLGHTRIAYVGEPYTADYYRAFVASMEQHGLSCCEEFTYNIDARLEAIGVEAAKLLLTSQKKPTAVLAAYDVVAISLIHELTQNGVRVPEDISVMGINNISASAYAQVPLTTVDVFSAEQDRAAVEILFNKILTENEAIHHITIEHKIIERDSTRKINTQKG